MRVLRREDSFFAFVDTWNQVVIHSPDESQYYSSEKSRCSLHTPTTNEHLLTHRSSQTDQGGHSEDLT